MFKVWIPRIWIWPAWLMTSGSARLPVTFSHTFMEISITRYPMTDAKVAMPLSRLLIPYATPMANRRGMLSKIILAIVRILTSVVLITGFPSTGNRAIM